MNGVSSSGLVSSRRDSAVRRCFAGNALFLAFASHRRRRPRLRRVRLALSNLMQAAVGRLLLAAAGILMIQLLGLCLGLLAAIFALFAWMTLQRYLPMSEGSLPAYLETAFFPRLRHRLLGDLALLPLGPYELGGALVLERVERQLPGRLLAIHAALGAVAGIIVYTSQPTGPGDLVLVACLAAITVALHPVLEAELARSIAEGSIEDVLARADDSHVSQGALATTQVALNLFYLPLLLVLFLLEGVFVYVLLQLLWSLVLQSLMPTDPSPELRKALVGLSFLPLLLLRGMLLDVTRSGWQRTFDEAAIRLSGPLTRLMEEAAGRRDPQPHRD